ncbi:dephospho-CoA kinase, partial [bacterium]|nr:dephospho-CoA kinase [bacterium]
KYFNIPIHDSDYEVKKLIENNRLVKREIKKEWSGVIYINKGKEIVNKNKLSELIFKNTTYKLKLEKIIHPLVLKERDKFLKNHKKKNFLVAIDVPLLYETGINEICDYIFLALTSEKNQKKRVLGRPNMTEEKFSLIKKNQWSDKMKMSQFPYIINTSYGKILTFILITFYLLTIFFKEKVIKV